MSTRLQDRPVSVRTGSLVTWRGKPREVILELAEDGGLSLRLEGCQLAVQGRVFEVFWMLARRSDELRPRVLKGKRVGCKAPGVDAYARMYGVTPATVHRWKREGAPLADPDRMGDYVYRAKGRAA